MSVIRKLNEKQVKAGRRRRMKRFLKRAARKKYIRIRILSLLLFFCVICYLAAIVRWKDQLFYVKEDYTVKLESTGAGGQNEGATDLYGLIIRIKEGELELYRSRENVERISR